jgi:YHS domain-containing protein
MSSIFGRIFQSGKDRKVDIDPVCKMEVDIANPPGGKSEYQGKIYYFCAPGCKRAFDKEPQKYSSTS